MAKETEQQETESLASSDKAQDSPKLIFTLSANKQTTDLNVGKVTSEDASPRVDSPVEIPPLRKTSVLGIAKAKKRLQAFSLMKQGMLPLSPLTKKPPKSGGEMLEKIEKLEEKKKVKKGRFQCNLW